MTSLVQTTSTSIQTMGNGPSVLGEREVRIPVGGKIRAGIKRLTKKAAQNQQASEIYNKGIAAGASYGAIEKRIAEQCNIEYPLTPQNVPYFSAKRADFSMREIADRIMELYGEDQGEGRHLYRIPVIFAADTWLTNMPHGLKCYTRSQLQYWSEYGQDGARYCKMRAPVEVDPQNKRARRTFGGRPIVLRPDNGGACNPNNCPEYQAGKCKVSGGLIFYIPSIPGASAIEMPTTSLYGMQQLRQQMEMVAFLRGGKVSGTVDGKPIFWLTKKHEEVSRIGDDGRPMKVKQWLPHLEADLPMEKVFQQAEQQAVLSAGNQAAAALGGPSQDTISATPDRATEDDGSLEFVAQEAIFTAVESMQLNQKIFAAYAGDRWGENWSDDLDVLAEIQNEINVNQDALIEAVNSFDVPF